MLRVCEESEAVEFEAVWEGEGRFRMRIVGWYAAGGGGTTDVPVLEGEMISSGMGALLFLHSKWVNDSVINPGRTAWPRLTRHPILWRYLLPRLPRYPSRLG